VQQPNSGLSRLIVEVFRSYTIRHIGRCSQCMFSPNPYDRTAVVDLGLLFEVPRSHSVGLITTRMTPLDEGSTRRTDLYLTTHNTHGRQMSMSSAGFESTIPEIDRPQTHIVDLAATNNYLLWHNTKRLQSEYFISWKYSNLFITASFSHFGKISRVS
jgi:hypothetical protein